MAVKYGLLLSALFVISNLIVFSLNFEDSRPTMGFIAVSIAILTWIAKIGLFARAHYEYNEKNNDYISFKDAILIGLVIIGISTVVSFAVTFVNATFLMREKYEKMWSLGLHSEISPVKIILTGALTGILMDVIVLFFLITLESMWKIFKKAGKEGWAALVPFYNTITMLEIVGKPVLWFVLMFIPFVNMILGIWVVNLLAKRFGKSESYTLGMLFLPFIFYPMLGMSEQQMIPLYADEHNA